MSTNARPCFVPTFVYQRFPVPGGVNDPEVLQNNATEGEARIDDSLDFDVEDPFSDPSPVVDQPLSIPTEQSSSASASEGEEQSRKATPSVGSVSGHFKGTVKPHFDSEEWVNKRDDIEEVVDCQKTWGPSDNPFTQPIPSVRRRLSSCPTSPTEKYFAVRQACQVPSIADEVQILEGSPFTQQDLYGLKEHIEAEAGQLGSVKKCTGAGGSKLSGVDRQDNRPVKQSGFQEHEIINHNNISKDLQDKQKKKQSVPVECTHPPLRDTFLNSYYKSTVQKFEEFGHLESYDYDSSSFINIYSRLERVKEINFSGMKHFNEGGNGTMYSYGDFAIKQTVYNEKALNVIRKLHHPNIVELLGVALLGPYSEVCFHVMPLMTYDLYRGLRSVGSTLCQLSRKSSDGEWVTIRSNIVYILKEVLRGLSYLEERYIQHGDIKEKNILIKKTCRCPDILNCTCPYDKKYSVKLADLDYIDQSESYRDPPNIWCMAVCNPCRYRGGTLTYRGPEESIQDHLGHRLNGTWSDIYCLGVLLLKICFGEGSWKEKQEANVLAGQPHALKLMIGSEAIYVKQIFVKFLQELVACERSQRRMLFLVDIIRDCLRVSPDDRPTAHKLLQYQPLK